MLIDRFSGRRVLVVGDVILDHFVSGAASRVSPEAPALVLHAHADRWMPGGAANVALNIASLGGTAIIVGVIGRDHAGAELKSLIGAAGPQVVPELIEEEAARTIQKTRYLAGDRHLLRVDRETIGVSEPTGRKVIEAALARIDECDAVVISDYAKGVITPAVVAQIVAAAGRAGTPVLVDPKQRNLELYRGATVLTPNRAELAAATGEPCDDDASRARGAAAATAATGAAILLTLAEQGMALYRGGEEIWREASRAHAVRDVSGAGDTVIAVCALGLAAGGDLVEAARLSNVAAGVVVAKSSLSSLTREELTQALSERSDTEPPPGKLVSAGAAIAAREYWRAQGLSVGLTNGCFDLLHPGHVQLLTQARATCDRLVVALNSDASVRRLKGPERPVQDEQARAAVIGAMRCVDLVVLFDEDTPLELITAFRPDVLIKGADYAMDEVVGADVVKASKGEVVLVPLAQGHSTTRLIRRFGHEDADRTMAVD